MSLSMSYYLTYSPCKLCAPVYSRCGRLASHVILDTIYLMSVDALWLAETTSSIARAPTLLIWYCACACYIGSILGFYV